MPAPTDASADPRPLVRLEGNSPHEFSGKKLIVGVFLLAIVMSVALWIYWHLHTRPFQPLQLAIAQAFPKSYPYVQGGQRKIHKGTPRILRITMQVKFDPKPRDADEAVTAIVEQLEQLARQQLDLTNYDQLEVHLVQRRPEHDSITRTITRELASSGSKTK